MISRASRLAPRPGLAAVAPPAALALALFLSGCGLQKPETPTFETSLNIPAADEHYDTAQLIDSADYLETDPATGAPRFVVEGDFGPQGVATALDVAVQAQSYGATLSTIAVTDPPELSTHYPLTQLLGLVVPPAGGPSIIPGAVITPTRRALPAIEEFETATLDAGTLTITLTNNLPVALGGASPLKVRVYDAGGNTPILSAQATTTLATGASLALPVSLAGRTFTNHLEVEVEGSTPGSGSQSVLVRVEDGLDVNCALGGLSYRSATLKPVAQNIETDETLTLDPGVRLVSAAFQSGRLAARLSNTLPLPITVTLTAPEITRGGAPLVETHAVPAGSPASPARLDVTIDLAGASLMSAETDGSTSVRLRLAGRTEASGTPVALSSSMGVTAELAATTLALSAVTGRFDGKVVEVSPTVSTTDLPDDIETLRFEQATLTLDLENGAALAATTQLTLTGQRDGQPDVTLPLSGYRIEPARNGQPTTTRITLDQANSRLLELVHIYPGRVTLAGHVTLGDGTTTGSLNRADTVRGHFRLTAPLRFKFDAVEHVADSFSFTLGQKAQDAIRDHVTAADVEVKLVNRFPVAVTAVLQFAGDSLAAGDTADVVLAPVTIDAAPVDAAGKAVSGLTQTFTVTIPSDKIPFFARPTVWGTARLTLHPAAAGQAVEIQANDYVDVKALARFRYQVKP